MTSTLGAVGFCRVLNGLQIVCNRDDGKQDQQQDCQSHELHSPVAARPPAIPQPKAEHHCGEQNPGEIEEQLHCQT